MNPRLAFPTSNRFQSFDISFLVCCIQLCLYYAQKCWFGGRLEAKTVPLCSLPSCLAQTRAARSPRNTLCLFPREISFFLIFTKTLYRLAQVPLAQSLYTQLVLVQSLSRVRLFATPCTSACQASLSIINSWSLLKLMSIESVMPSNHLIICRPPSPPTFNLSQHQGLFQ